ncbi:hypothetical protein [Nocardia sp. NPDC005366]|uniref:hypothetical protein n=1 Tax=Nocardia sp. NPDC005366 TaxID=3156878 RepID=UPI00339FA977
MNLETDVFFGYAGKSDFVTPDFMMRRCLPPGADVRAADTVLVGEVLSPSNTPADIEANFLGRRWISDNQHCRAGAGRTVAWQVDCFGQS